MTTIEQRLDRIETRLMHAERRARRWRGAAIAASGLLALGLCGALASPNALFMETIRTGRLEVIGPDGKAVLVATSAPTGGQLDFWGRSGANTLRLGSSESGGDLVLWNQKGEQVVSAFATDLGGRFECFWSDGTPGFLAGVTKDKGAAVSLHNASGKEVIYAGSSRTAAGLLRVANANGESVGAIAAGVGGGVFESFTHGGAPAAVIGASMKGDAGMIQIGGPGTRVSPGADASKDGIAQVIFEVDARSDGAGRVAIGTAGTANIVLESSPQDAGLLSFFSAGKRMGALGVGSAGGQLNLSAIDGRPVVVLGAASDGQGGAMTVRGADGQPVVRASVDPRGEGEVVVYSANGSRKRVINAE